MKLFNTLTKTTEDFLPRNDNKVKMFVCGPTVYDFLHIGNARTMVVMDVLARVLRFNSYDLEFLMNITDIDDKIIARSKQQNITWKDLADKYESQYKEDMKNLKVKIDKFARATDHIDDVVRQVQTLIDKGYAYQIDDGIYFEIAKFESYGKLSGRINIKEDDAESRIDYSDQKRGWNDFCLWKFSKHDEPSWPADFGKGRPGWHIEDTAITEHYFGPQYDIHGGGSDLIFPHHEAEITQMESASGLSPFVKYWVHSNMLYIDGKRMGKSNQNFISIKQALETFSSNTLRLFFLQAHYRSQLSYSQNLIDSAKNRLVRWQAAADLRWQIQGETDLSSDLDQSLTKIIKAFSNDLDSPIALAEFEKIIDLIEAKKISQKSVESLNKLLTVFCELTGIDLLKEDISDEDKKIILERQDAKVEKDWQKADQLRDKLLAKNIQLNDQINNQSIWSRVDV